MPWVAPFQASVYTHDGKDRPPSSSSTAKFALLPMIGKEDFTRREYIHGKTDLSWRSSTCKVFFAYPTSKKGDGAFAHSAFSGKTGLGYLTHQQGVSVGHPRKKEGDSAHLANHQPSRIALSCASKKHVALNQGKQPPPLSRFLVSTLDTHRIHIRYQPICLTRKTSIGVDDTYIACY